MTIESGARTRRLTGLSGPPDLLDRAEASKARTNVAANEHLGFSP
jgi:hypothetical protein